MPDHHDNLVAFRKEISSLIDSARKEWDRVGATPAIPPHDLKTFTHLIADLHRAVAVYNYLQNLPEEKMPEVKTPEVKVAEVKTPEVKVQEVKIPEIVQEKKEPVAPPPPLAEKMQPAEKVQPAEDLSTEKAPGVHVKMEHKMPEVPPASKKMLPDLKSFIGFNERIMFQRNLFGNDAAAYDRGLSELNATSSMSEANSILSRLSAQYHWNQDSEPVHIFLSTVKRRFT